MGDRGRREAQALITVMVIAAVVAGIVAVLAGSDSADEALRPSRTMAAPPEMQWQVDAAGIFGPDFAGARLSVQDASDDLVILTATAPEIGMRSGLIALDPETGEPVWQKPRIGWEGPCALSTDTPDDDQRLACLQLIREDGVVATRVSFIDPRTGADLSTDTIRVEGSSFIEGNDGGFIVTTREMENLSVPEDFVDVAEVDIEFFTTTYASDQIPDAQVTVTGFDSGGRKMWTVRPPVNHDQLDASPGGDTFAVRGSLSRGGLSIYRSDSGRVLYSTPTPQPGEGQLSAQTAVLHPDGFVIGQPRRYGDGRIEFFDADGVRVGELDGWNLVERQPFGEPVTLVDGDAVPLSSARGVAIASAREGLVRWESRPSPPPETEAATPLPPPAMSMLDGPLALRGQEQLPTGSADHRTTWTAFDVRTGIPRGEFSTDFGRYLIGSVGSRVYFEGEAGDRSPTVSLLSAFDAYMGAQLWQLAPRSHTARWELISSHLFLIDDGAPEGGGPRSIARYAA